MSAKSKDTTKTAHVMNLLRKNTGSTQPAEPTVQPEPNLGQDEPISIQPKAVPAQHPIITSLNEEAVVSQEIKDALEQELLDLDPPAQPEPDEQKLDEEAMAVEEPTQAEPPLYQLPARF